MGRWDDRFSEMGRWDDPFWLKDGTILWQKCWDDHAENLNNTRYPGESYPPRVAKYSRQIADFFLVCFSCDVENLAQKESIFRKLTKWCQREMGRSRSEKSLNGRWDDRTISVWEKTEWDDGVIFFPEWDGTMGRSDLKIWWDDGTISVWENSSTDDGTIGRWDDRVSVKRS